MFRAKSRTVQSVSGSEPLSLDDPGTAFLLKNSPKVVDDIKNVKIEDKTICDSSILSHSDLSNDSMIDHCHSGIEELHSPPIRTSKFEVTKIDQTSPHIYARAVTPKTEQCLSDSIYERENIANKRSFSREYQFLDKARKSPLLETLKSEYKRDSESSLDFYNNNDSDAYSDTHENGNIHNLNKCGRKTKQHNLNWSDSDSDSSDSESYQYGRLSNTSTKKRKPKKRHRLSFTAERVKIQKCQRISIKDAIAQIEKIDKIEERVKNEIQNSYGINEDGLVCKFLICILWDFDFRYILLPHQYLGVLGVTGLDVKHLEQSLRDYGLNKEYLDDLFDLSEAGTVLRKRVCRKIKFVKTGGILIADDMGLGKTIEGLGGCILRNRIANVKRERGDSNLFLSAKTLLPTLIVCPNDTVLKQWKETLIKSGIDESRIQYFCNNNNPIRKENTYVLLTRYNLMAEMRKLLQDTGIRSYRSALFPKIPDHLLQTLKSIYRASKGEVQKNNEESNELSSKSLNRRLLDEIRSVPIKRKAFETVVLDESHFLKNAISYWGFGASLLGMHSKRTVLLTGTPYNNSPQDMATQMMYIEPSHKAAGIKWWHAATSAKTKKEIGQMIREWKYHYMIRRTKSVLSTQLPLKKIETIGVRPHQDELEVYLNLEKKFMKVLNEFSKILERIIDETDPEIVKRAKSTFLVLMARMTQMRASTVHPILPGGREMTILFSPSRRHLLPNCEIENKRKCVYCSNYPSFKEQDFKKMNDEEANEVLNDMDVTEDNEEFRNVDFEFSNNSGNLEKDIDELIPLNSSKCYASKECKHYIHRGCLEKLEGESICPRCHDLEVRMNISKEQFTNCCTYCKHIRYGNAAYGIQVSTKIQEVINWVKSIPEDDKAIIYSFFKGSLDILEGIFVEDFGFECARFDGDITAGPRIKELEYFQKTKSCRFLLASVQSGGVGLNIVEANHVVFIDRWFNPCVHTQAEDRCHRLKQEKTTYVKYFDVNMTVDEVMAVLSAKKQDNASILLADGTDIGPANSKISYKELGGTIGKMMKVLESERNKVLKASTSSFLPTLGIEKLEEAINENMSKAYENDLDKNDLECNNSDKIDSNIPGTNYTDQKVICTKNILSIKSEHHETLNSASDEFSSNGVDPNDMVIGESDLTKCNQKGTDVNEINEKCIDLTTDSDLNVNDPHMSILDLREGKPNDINANDIDAYDSDSDCTYLFKRVFEKRKCVPNNIEAIATYSNDIDTDCSDSNGNDSDDSDLFKPVFPKKERN